MLKQAVLRQGRKGFTLVEVALAVAVGLIIIGGAVLGYNAVKDNASNSNARNRVLSAVTMIEEFSAANGGRYPTSAAAGGPFSTMWAAKRPDDASASPWGGLAGAGTGANDGVVEFAAANFTVAADPVGSDPASVTTTTAAIPTTVAVANAANLCYISSTTTATPWAAIVTTSTGAAVGVKNYAVGIHDKLGTPWWDAKGGK